MRCVVNNTKKQKKIARQVAVNRYANVLIEKWEKRKAKKLRSCDNKRVEQEGRVF